MPAAARRCRAAGSRGRACRRRGPAAGRLPVVGAPWRARRRSRAGVAGVALPGAGRRAGHGGVVLRGHAGLRAARVPRPCGSRRGRAGPRAAAPGAEPPPACPSGGAVGPGPCRAGRRARAGVRSRACPPGDGAAVRRAAGAGRAAGRPAPERAAGRRARSACPAPAAARGGRPPRRPGGRPADGPRRPASSRSAGARAARRCQPQRRLAEAQQGARRAAGPGGRPPRVPSSVVPFVEPRSATVTRPSSATVTAQCSRETSGSSSGTSASAERPMRIWPPCSRWTPPASGPATTWSWAGGVVHRRGSASAGALQGQHRAVDQRRLAQRAALGVEPLRARVQHDRAAAEASGRPDDGRGAAPEATAASAVPAGAVTSTSQPRRGPAARAGRPRGVEDGQPDLHRRQRSLLRGVPGRGRRPASPPTRHGRVARYTSHGARGSRPTLRAGGILAPATDNTPAARPASDLDWSALAAKVPDQCPAAVNRSRRRSRARPPVGNHPSDAERLPFEHVRAAARTARARTWRRPAGARTAALEWVGHPGRDTVAPDHARTTSSRERMTCGR